MYENPYGCPEDMGISNTKNQLCTNLCAKLPEMICSFSSIVVMACYSRGKIQSAMKVDFHFIFFRSVLQILALEI